MIPAPCGSLLKTSFEIYFCNITKSNFYVFRRYSGSLLFLQMASFVRSIWDYFVNKEVKKLKIYVYQWVYYLISNNIIQMSDYDSQFSKFKRKLIIKINYAHVIIKRELRDFFPIFIKHYTCCVIAKFITEKCLMYMFPKKMLKYISAIKESNKYSINFKNLLKIFTTETLTWIPQNLNVIIYSDNEIKTCLPGMYIGLILMTYTIISKSDSDFIIGASVLISSFLNNCYYDLPQTYIMFARIINLLYTSIIMATNMSPYEYNRMSYLNHFIPSFLRHYAIHEYSKHHGPNPYQNYRIMTYGYLYNITIFLISCALALCK